MSFPPYEPPDENPFAAPEGPIEAHHRGDAGRGCGRTLAACLLAAAMPFVGVVIGLMVSSAFANQAVDDLATHGEEVCGLFVIPYLFRGIVGGFLGGLVVGIVIAVVTLFRSVSPQADAMPES